MIHSSHFQGNRDSRKHSHPTSLQIDNWKHIIEQKIYCDKNDVKCWKKLLPQLPCLLDDTQCWKNRYPQMPCSSNDEQCWRKLLPQLPCKLHDDQCWRKFHTDKVEEFSPRLKNMTSQNISNVMIQDTDAIWLV